MCHLAQPCHDGNYFLRGRPSQYTRSDRDHYNLGRYPVEIDLSDDTLYVTPLLIRDGDIGQLQGTASRPTTGIAHFKSVAITPGNTVKLSYLTPASRSGEYVVEFRAPIKGDVANQAGTLGMSDGQKYDSIWTAGTFVNVPRAKERGTNDKKG